MIIFVVPNVPHGQFFSTKRGQKYKRVATYKQAHSRQAKLGHISSFLDTRYYRWYTVHQPLLHMPVEGVTMGGYRHLLCIYIVSY